MVKLIVAVILFLMAIAFPATLATLVGMALPVAEETKLFVAGCIAVGVHLVMGMFISHDGNHADPG